MGGFYGLPATPATARPCGRFCASALPTFNRAVLPPQPRSPIRPGLFKVINLLLLAIAGLTALAGFAAWIWLLAVAFRRSPGWGFLVLFIPPAGLVFAITFWDEARRPFLAGTAAAVVTALLVVGVTVSTGRSIQRQLKLEMSKAQAEADAELVRQQRASPQRVRRRPPPPREAPPVASVLRREEPPSTDPESRPEAPVEEVEAPPEQSEEVDTGGGPALATEAPPLAREDAPEPEETQPAPAETEAAGEVAEPRSSSRGGRLPTAPPGRPTERGLRSVSLSDASHYVGRRVIVETREGRRERGRLLAIRGNRLEFRSYPGGGELTFTLPRDRIAVLLVEPD